MPQVTEIKKINNYTTDNASNPYLGFCIVTDDVMYTSPTLLIENFNYCCEEFDAYVLVWDSEVEKIPVVCRKFNIITDRNEDDTTPIEAYLPVPPNIKEVRFDRPVPDEFIKKEHLEDVAYATINIDFENSTKVMALYVYNSNQAYYPHNYVVRYNGKEKISGLDKFH